MVKKWHYLSLKSERPFDNEKWYNRPITSLCRLLRGITSNHNGDFYCLNCCHSCHTDNKLKKHENVCNEHDYCYPEMSAEDNEILEYNHGESLNVSFIIYFDLESLLPKIHSCQNNPKKSYAERKAKHEPSGCTCYVTCSFDSTKKKHGYFRGKDCIEVLCKKFKELAMEIINYEEKGMIPLTDEEKDFYEKQKVCHIWKKEFYLMKMKKGNLNFIIKSEIITITLEAVHSICNLKYKVPKEIPVVVHNGSAYDYHFIIKQLAEEFKGNFECLGENDEKIYYFFSTN